MRTVTLELPDDLAATLEAMPEDERNHYATALMRDGLAYREEDEEADPEVIVALQASIAEVEAGGRLLTLEDMDAAFAEREARVLAKMGR
jgi:hypothetical protein